MCDTNNVGTVEIHYNPESFFAAEIKVEFIITDVDKAIEIIGCNNSSSFDANVDTIANIGISGCVSDSTISTCRGIRGRLSSINGWISSIGGNRSRYSNAGWVTGATVYSGFENSERERTTLAVCKIPCPDDIDKEHWDSMSFLMREYLMRGRDK